MKKYGFTKELYIKIDDKELIDVSKNFLVDIEEKFKNFKEEYEKDFLNLQKYTNNNNFIFEPEKLSKKSPLTIINAPWGTGKTFFIENFIKLFIDKKIESNVFKKIIIIDAWKFSNSKDVPVEFAIELSNKIINMQIGNESKETKEVIKQKILDWIVPDSLIWKLNFFNFISLKGEHTNKNIKESKNEEDVENIKKVWKRIQENNEPTIIFIDNLERLGSSSWDLLKAILKIQEFDNYLIVLPLNLNKFSNNKRVDNSEYPIEKYIDFNYYNLKQDYSNFFNKHIKENKEFIEKLNLIFNSEIDGEKLSIREVENSFKTHELFKITDKYNVLKTIREHIWHPEETFNKFLKNDVEYFLENERKKCSIYLEVVNNMLSKDKMGKFINISESHLKQNSNIVIWEKDTRYIYTPNFDYLNDYNNLVKIIKMKKNENLKAIKSADNEINKINESIKGHETEVHKLETEKSKLETQEKIEKQRTENYNDKKHQRLIERIQLIFNKIKDINLLIQKLKKENENYKNLKIFLEENNTKIFDISIKIKELNEINKNDKLPKKYKEEILSILNNNFENISESIERKSNFNLSKISF